MPRLPDLNSTCVALLALLACCAGCVPLTPAKQEPSRLPPSRLPADAIVVDIANVRLPPGNSAAYEAIWNAADEQTIPLEVRRELAANGMRAGVYGQHLPSALRELIDAPQPKLSDLTEVSSSEFDFAKRQHLPLRAGQRSIVQASAVFPTLAVLTMDGGSVRGHQLSQARCTLALKAYPIGDGRAKLSLTPEIEHGEMKARWMGSEGMMIQQTSQERLVLDRLACDVVLRPGQWLVFSTTPEAKGLGGHFFAQESGDSPHRRLLVFRYSQTQFDDLFAPEQTKARLATPAE